MVTELDAGLELGESGIKTHYDLDAINQKIITWLNIIKGEYWGKPWKGNNLRQFQFLSPTPTVLTVLEMKIAEDLEDQVPIRILNITCKKATSTDKVFRLYLVYQVQGSGEIGIFNEDFLNKKLG